MNASLLWVTSPTHLPLSLWPFETARDGDPSYGAGEEVTARRAEVQARADVGLHQMSLGLIHRPVCGMLWIPHLRSRSKCQLFGWWCSSHTLKAHNLSYVSMPFHNFARCRALPRLYLLDRSGLSQAHDSSQFLFWAPTVRLHTDGSLAMKTVLHTDLYKTQK